MSGDRRLNPIVAIGGAVAVAIVVVVVILLLGIRQPPSFPTVAARHDARLAGRIAYVHEEKNQSCVVAVDLPSGAEHRVVCGREGDWSSRDVWWDATGALDVVLYAQGGPFIVTFDATSGRELARRAQTPTDGPDDSAWTTVRKPDGAELTTHSDDGSVHVRLTSGDRERDLLSARGPRDYSLWDVSWSPDGRWALVSDSEQRVLLVSATAPNTALLLSEHAHSAVWSK